MRRGAVDGLFPAAWRGAALAALTCVVASVAFDLLVGELVGKVEQAVEGTLALTAAGLLGLAVAAVLGVGIYRGGAKLDIGRFFWWTGLLLLVFAAGLFAKGVHEYRELFGIEWSLLATPVWTITSGPLAAGHQVHDFLAGLFGWSPEPERIRVATYLAYLAGVLALYLRSPTTPPAPAAGRG